MPEQTLPSHVKKVVFSAPKTVRVIKEPLPALQEGEFLVKTLYSAISAGTELTFFNGTNIKSVEGWDKQLQLFRGDIEPDLQDVYPKLEGYMESAVVVASRNPEVKPGQNIAALYGHKDYHIMTPGQQWLPLPEGMDPILGVSVAKMGPICMNGTLYAADEVQRQAVGKLPGSLQGQRVLVLGAGVVGLMSALFAKWAGAEEVAIADGIEERLAVAQKLGFKPFPVHSDLPVRVKRHWLTADPLNTGADLVLQCTGSDYLLNLAFSCLREQGTVIDLGFYQQGANELMFGKEFHHNRLRHICAQIGAMPRHQQANWDRRRLAEATIDFLRDNGDDFKDHVITHVLPFSEAQSAFDGLARRDPSMLQVVLTPDNV